MMADYSPPDSTTGGPVDPSEVPKFALTLTTDYFELFEFNVEKKLWSGRYGDVLLARSERYPDNTRVVRKAGILPKDLEKRGLTLGELKKLYYNETSILKFIDHENILGGFNLVVCPEYILVAMDYCELGSLRDLLPTMTYQDMYVFSYGLIRALVYLHFNKIFHGDIKPSKLLVTRDHETKLRTLKLAGFRLAGRCVTTQDTVNHYNNCPVFRVPEVWNATGPDNVNPFMCDIYKLGLVLLCMVLKMEKPDYTEDPSDVALTHPCISRHVSLTLTNCLQADPSRRVPIDDTYKFWKKVRVDQCRPPLRAIVKQETNN